MFFRTYARAIVATLIFGVFAAHAARADELVLPSAPTQDPAFLMSLPPEPAAPSTDELRADDAAQPVRAMLDGALELIGIRYRRGGSTPERGFDCSGFVGHVFQEGLGLYLPRSAKEMSKTGRAVTRDELKPGDLVFFNTMRRAFSHVGIYLGDNRFLHAPRTGGKVRIEQIDTRYWLKRFNGARRVAD